MLGRVNEPRPACLKFFESELDLHERSCFRQLFVAGGNRHHLLEGAL